MKIIQPYDLSIISLDALEYDKKILKIDANNKMWHSTILPKSTIINKFGYSSDRIITQIDDSIFTDMGFILLDKREKTIIENNGRKLIKTIEIGDYIDSVKRYTNMNVPLDINSNAREFLNLIKPNQLRNQLDVKKPINFTLDSTIERFKPKEKSGIFDSNINHPHINRPKLNKDIKHNDKSIIIQILRWAKEKNIKYIYSINEYRPYIMSKNYVTPYVFYTIKGF